MSVKFIGFNIVALMTEVNSVFLHARKLMQLFGVGFKDIRYRILCVVNLISLVLFRFTALTAIVYGIIYYRNAVSLSYFVAITSTMAVMWPINTVLFWRLLKNDVFCYSSYKKYSHTKYFHQKYRSNGFSENDDNSSANNFNTNGVTKDKQS